MDSDAIVVRFDPSLRNVHGDRILRRGFGEQEEKVERKGGIHLQILNWIVCFYRIVLQVLTRIVQSDLLETYQDRRRYVRDASLPFGRTVMMLEDFTQPWKRFPYSSSVPPILTVKIPMGTVDDLAKVTGHETCGYTRCTPSIQLVFNHRLIRICQVIILPTFQRRGHGRRLFRHTSWQENEIAIKSRSRIRTWICATS